MAQELQVVPVTLTSDIYVAISRDATLRGETVAEIASKSLTELYKKKVDPRIEEEKQAARDEFRSLFGMADYGRPLGTDNEQIDADLAREYGSNHEDE